MTQKKIAWAITGAGHFLAPCAARVLSFGAVDAYLSRAADEVIRMYGLQGCLIGEQLRVRRESLASSPAVVGFSRGTYRVLVVAPATSNSVAKFVCGISDSLVSNLFAQAGKSRVPIIVLPTDLAPEMDSTGPHGDLIKVYPRRIDLENTARLRTFSGVTVVESVDELATRLAALI